MAKEIWKAVVGFEGLYEVSDQGRVRSVARTVKYTKKKGWLCERRFDTRMRKLQKWGDYIGLSLCKNGKVRRYTVHTLVLKAFVGPKPADQEARHLDGKHVNNKLRNLCWGTRLENSADTIRHGRIARGERSGTSKLTANKIRAIRKLRAEKHTIVQLGKMFGVGHSYISRIVKKRVWAHV